MTTTRPGVLLIAALAVAVAATACDDSPTAPEGSTNPATTTGATTTAGAPPTTSDVPAEPALTVAEALVSEEIGIIAVRGYIVVDARGARLCDGIAESFPPQCAEPSIALVGGPDQNLAILAVEEPGIVREADGTTWTERSVRVLGTMVEGGLIDDVITP